MGKGPNIHVGKVKEMKAQLRTDITPAKNMSIFSIKFQASRTHIVRIVSTWSDRTHFHARLHVTEVY